MNGPDHHDKQMELTGPGRRLMEARNALNISREDVARQLRLKLKTIIAIEEDRVDELPAPIYVVGYLRNYARLLKIPHEPIVDAYEQLNIEAPPIISDIVKPQKKRMTTKLVRWSSIAIGIILLAGFVSWLQTQNFDLFKTVPVTVSDDVAPGEKEIVIEPESIVPDIIQPTLIEELPAISDQRPVAAVEDTSEEAIAEGAITEAVREGEKIVMSFAGDCWTEIIDADGKTVIYDLLREGRAHTFYAKAPFTIFLGNASTVNMSVNGKDYDVTPHIRGKLARFTVNVNDGA